MTLERKARVRRMTVKLAYSTDKEIDNLVDSLAANIENMVPAAMVSGNWNNDSHDRDDMAGRIRLAIHDILSDVIR